MSRPARTPRSRLLGAGIALTLAVGLAACGAEADADNDAQGPRVLGTSAATPGGALAAPRDRADLIEFMSRRMSVIDFGWVRKRYDHAMPNVTIAYGNGAVPGSEVAVVGHAISLTDPAGYRAGGNKPLPLGHPDADYAVATLTVRVDEQLGGPAVGPTLRVRVPMPPEGDLGRLERGWVGLGTLVLPLYRWEHDGDAGEDGPYRVVEENQLVVTVAADGTLALPFLDESAEPRSLLDPTPTLDALRTAAGSGPREVQY